MTTESGRRTRGIPTREAPARQPGGAAPAHLEIECSFVRGLVAAILAAVEPAGRVEEALREGPAALDAAPPVTALFALGKAAAGLARGAAGVLGVPLFPEGGGSGVAPGFRGVLARPASAPALFPPDRGGPPALGPWEEWPGGHPLPNVDSFGAGHGLLRLLRGLGPEDHLLALVSGGGSACCEVPAGVLSIADLVEAQRALLASGRPIDRVNAVRKHLSQVKGGLALRATAARVTVLVLSDVPSDDPSVVASGPFAPDASTYGEALAVAESLGRNGSGLPRAVLRHLEAGVTGDEPETLKPGDAEAERARHHLLAGHRTAAGAAADWLRARGYRVEVGDLFGEAAVAGRELVERGRRLAAEGDGPVALVLSGETTVALGDARGPAGNRGETGGRNQELALTAARALSQPADFQRADGGAPGREQVLALATDGEDGPTPAAGAVVDPSTWGRLEEAGADPEAALRRHASFTALSRLGETVLRTGPTGTNVADVALYLRS